MIVTDFFLVEWTLYIVQICAAYYIHWLGYGRILCVW